MSEQLGLGTAQAPAATSDAARIAQTLKLQAAVKGGGSWFYWIAGLSMVNTIILFSGKTWHFIMGLGITTIVDYAARGAGGVGHVAALFVNAFIAGLFILFGTFARKGAAWAFVIGMIFYAIDGLIFLLVKDMLGLAFHGFALFCMWGGLAAHRKLAALRQASLAASGAPLGPA